ncbi:SAM-dependent methyltransferase [Kitasatospora sp. MAA4]|uniref:class I SAM-dependent methyltransferase n=1 Tax=Kitasatospora sp. MAA4 TaxID=3035093 RepID=UPI002475C85E|nr:class I SAM-dependent methyltransferase [Kitasatospora sp. MAA4]MDH6130682.1 SAM-dependent methyltransferase [Kitasatospora sp. MAA4]
MSQDRIPPRVRAMYGPEDLSSSPSFAGGYINFGYWEAIPLTDELDDADRTRSQQDLYRRVLGEFGRPAGSRVAEIGCGRGLGSALALREFDFASVCGVDIHPEQLARARAANAELLATHGGRLCYELGAADAQPFPDASLDALYSVEAAQHFRELTGFARESARVLRPGGQLVMTTFFSTGPQAAAPLAELLESFADGLDVAHPIDDFEADLGKAGFTSVRVESIGAAVWPGLDRYLEGTPVRGLWPRNFLIAWRQGLLDYYLVSATRAEEG